MNLTPEQIAVVREALQAATDNYYSHEGDEQSSARMCREALAILDAPPAPIDEAAERKEMAKPFRDFFGAEFADPDWEMEHVFWYEAWLAAKRHERGIKP